MLAVGEAALQLERLDVLEQAVERTVAGPQLSLAQPWRVDDHAAAGQLDELAVRGHVPAFTSAEDLACLHHRRARHAVDERGLARA